MRRLGSVAALTLVLTACGGTGDDVAETGNSPPSPATTLTATATTAAPDPTDLTVEIETTSTTSAEPASDWAVGGTVIATGPLEGSFEVSPLCDVRNDADGEFLNVAFGYQDLEELHQPTVRVVMHVRGWRDQGEFVAELEAQYQTGTSIEDLTLEDAAGEASLSIAFIDNLGGVAVATIDVEGSFDGPFSGTVSADLTCLAG